MAQSGNLLGALFFLFRESTNSPPWRVFHRFRLQAVEAQNPCHLSSWEDTGSRSPTSGRPLPNGKGWTQVSFPIGNRTARSEAQIAEANTKQSVIQQQQLEMTVESQVRDNLQHLVNSDLLLNAAHRAAQLAQQQYDSEQRQFKAGTSSVFLVLQRQSELINAKLREIRATTDRSEAEANTTSPTANTLSRQKIDIVAERGTV